MKGLSQIWLGWLIAVAAVAVAVQPAHAARIITIDEAIKIALERNVTLNEARVTAGLDSVAVSEARMQFVPNLAVTSSGTQYFGRYYDSNTGSTVDQTSKSLT